MGAFRVRLALLRGELAPARAWLPAAGGLPAHWLDSVLDSPPLTRAWARLRLAPEAPSPAAALAAALADVGRPPGRDRAPAPGHPAGAGAGAAGPGAARAGGDATPALDSLARALDLGEPGGLVRTFADLGPPLAALLRLLVARAPRLGLPPAGARRLRRRRRPAARPPRRPRPRRRPARRRPSALVEPLTGRELEVLDRLRRQWLNKEIAADLHVSPETVKTHTANLYAKLGVGDRRRAVRRAAELGLLPPP